MNKKSIGINFESVKGYIRRKVKYEPRLEGRLKEVYGRKIDRVNGENSECDNGTNEEWTLCEEQIL